MAFELKPLRYWNDALEPYIDTKTIEIHHWAHHKTYLDKFNAAISGSEYETWQLEKILANLELLPESIRTIVKNNWWGYYNHNIYFDWFIPWGSQLPLELWELFDKYFDSFEKFKEDFTNVAINTFGSWRACLARRWKDLVIYSLFNQETALMKWDVPLIMLDVWEHAYYLKHQNKRPAHIWDFFNIVDWNRVLDLYKDYRPL